MTQTQYRVRFHRVALTLAAAAACVWFSPARARAVPCVGDCNGDGTVTVSELVMMVNMALGTADMSACAADVNGDGVNSVDELVRGTLSVLDGCEPVAGPTPTPTPGGQCGTFN